MSEHNQNNEALKKHEAWVDNTFIQEVSSWSMENDEEQFSEQKALEASKEQSEKFNSSLDMAFK